MAALSCVVVKAREGPATGAVVFLHGSGKDGRGTRDLIQKWMGPGYVQGHPYVDLYFPTAPQMWLKMRDQVTTCWFDSQRTGRSIDDFSINYADADKSCDLIISIIKEIEASGIPKSRIALAGMSQGAMVAQYIAFTKLQGLAGVLAMASIYPFYKAKFMKPPLPPVQYLWGEKDPIIPRRGIEAAEMYFKAHQVQFSYRVLPESSHEIDEHFVKNFVWWLGSAIPPSNS